MNLTDVVLHEHMDVWEKSKERAKRARRLTRGREIVLRARDEAIDFEGTYLIKVQSSTCKVSCSRGKACGKASRPHQAFNAQSFGASQFVPNTRGGEEPRRPRNRAGEAFRANGTTIPIHINGS